MTCEGVGWIQYGSEVHVEFHATQAHLGPARIVHLRIRTNAPTTWSLATGPQLSDFSALQSLVLESGPDAGDVQPLVKALLAAGAADVQYRSCREAHDLYLREFRDTQSVRDKHLSPFWHREEYRGLWDPWSVPLFTSMFYNLTDIYCVVGFPEIAGPISGERSVLTTQATCNEACNTR